MNVFSFFPLVQNSTLLIIIIFCLLFIFVLQKNKNKNKILQLEKYSKFFEDNCIFFTANDKFEITYANDNFCKLSLYELDELINKENFFIFSEYNNAYFFSIQNILKETGKWSGVLKHKKSNNQIYWIDTYIKLVKNNFNQSAEYLIVCNDVTNLLEKNQELEKNFGLDLLTELKNKYQLEKDLNNFKNPSICMIDISNFSDINDFFGHKIGDGVLKIVSKRIQKLIKDNPNYFLYKDHSDFFYIICNNEEKDIFISNIKILSNLISQIPIEIRKRELHINLNYFFSFESKEKILETVNIVKRYSKINNNIIAYDKNLSLEKYYQKNIYWALKLKKALNNNMIVPYFQPIFDLKTNEIKKYEALIRLVDGDNVISPYHFLDISKRSKQYLKLTKTMLTKTFNYFKNKDYDFSINLTFYDIKSDYITSFIVELLEEYKIGNRVVFEILDNEKIDNLEIINDFFLMVKEYDCKIAIDNFGSGYLNFQYLSKLKLDYIKITGSIIKDIVDNKNNQNILSALVDFAKEHNIITVAKFVSNKDILEKVKSLGVDCVQGYYIKEPKAEIDEFDKIVNLEEIDI